LDNREEFCEGQGLSIKVMQDVWQRSEQKGSALLLLLAIADHAHDDGAGAYPSVETLARKVRMSRRNTQLLIRHLEKAGEIQVEHGAGPRGCNLYAVKTLQGVKNSVAGGAKQRSRGVKPVSPRTINGGRTVIKPSEQVSQAGRSHRSSTVCDEEFLTELQARRVYATLDVRFVYGKMVVWCDTNGKQPTRSRLINWLNREERPMTAAGGFHNAERRETASERNARLQLQSDDLLV
jgi:Helix-turn-helix domain